MKKCEHFGTSSRYENHTSSGEEILSLAGAGEVELHQSVSVATVSLGRVATAAAVRLVASTHMLLLVARVAACWVHTRIVLVCAALRTLLWCLRWVPMGWNRRISAQSLP